MTKRELTETLMEVVNNALANLHTATIARVEAVNATTIDCKPVTNRVVNGESIQLPVFVDVPPLFMQGGSSYTAHPIAKGDYCLLIITERCFDSWYNGEDFVDPLEFRMHDYSDGIAIVGVNPSAGAIGIPQVITHIGDTFQQGDYEHQGNRVQVGDHTQTGNFTLTGDMQVNGNITCTGTISAGNFTGLGGGAMTSNVNIETTEDVVADGVSLKTHTHGGVAAGSSSTGVPE